MLKPPVVFVFSGQGSQSYHMGRELFEKNTFFRSKLSALNELARNISGVSIVDLMYDEQRKKTDAFDQTIYTHPAIFMVEVALAKCLINEGVKPDYVLGTSLGGFAAAVIAGCLSELEGLTAVIKQAQFINTFCSAGRMVAILDSPTLFELRPELHRYGVIASVNFDSHFVMSMNQQGAQAVGAYLESHNISHQFLAVSHAFHSPWISPAQPVCEAFLQTLDISPPEIPFVCAVSGRNLKQLSPDYFWQLIQEPIMFKEAVNSLEQHQSCQYIDVGPSGTLATFLKYILPKTSRSLVNSLMPVFGSEYKALEKFLINR
ncbi:MAG: hypothetical protein COA42_14720 [Alteromonadaceae bacterium]|nr:MAG: hypothetical protein COA42_14720 [Alteromonadaceae bacterium]